MIAKGHECSNPTDLAGCCRADLDKFSQTIVNLLAFYIQPKNCNYSIIKILAISPFQLVGDTQYLTIQQRCETI